MPLPDGYGDVFSFPAFPLATRGVGTYHSDVLYDSQAIIGVILWVYASTVVATGAVSCVLESSPDGTTWTGVVGSSPAALSSAGSASGYAAVPSGNLFRVTSVVTGAAVTYQVLAVINVPGD